MKWRGGVCGGWGNITEVGGEGKDGAVEGSGDNNEAGRGERTRFGDSFKNQEMEGKRRWGRVGDPVLGFRTAGALLCAVESRTSVLEKKWAPQ